jgi:hypothetical protein
MADQIVCAGPERPEKKYIYDVHRRHPQVTPNEPGNFIYAKLDQQNRWVPILMGQGDLTQRAAMDRRHARCIEARGATHVHLHVNFKKEDRLAEERDLLDNFPQAYAPEGCNEKSGR